MMFESLMNENLVPTQEFVEPPKPQAPQPQFDSGNDRPKPERYPQIVAVPKPNGASTYYMYLSGKIDNVGNAVMLLDAITEEFDVVVILAMPSISPDNVTVVANALHSTKANTKCMLISASSLYQAIIAVECKSIEVTSLSTVWMALLKTPNGGNSADQKDRLEDDIKFESSILSLLVERGLLKEEEAQSMWHSQKISVLHGQELVSRVEKMQHSAE